MTAYVICWGESSHPPSVALILLQYPLALVTFGIELATSTMTNLHDILAAALLLLGNVVASRAAGAGRGA